MRNASATKGKTTRLILIALTLCLCMLASCAFADAYMPVTSEPPAVPVYWQLTRIDVEPQVRAKGGFTAEYEAEGFALDLSDPLMAESIAEAGESDPLVSLTIENSARAQKQNYAWTPMPVYMEPGERYAIEVRGESVENTEKLDSILSVNEQGEQVLRISAGGYNGIETSAVYDLAPLNTKEMVVSFVVRDVNDMFRLRVAYTYTLAEGVRPYPTPVPGFVATEAPEEIPFFYEPVEGKDGLWRVTTAPEEYRAYGVMSGEGPNFFPADDNGEVVMNETPVTPEQDYDNFVAGFVPSAAENDPEGYTKNENGVYSFVTRDGQTEYRAYGRVNGGEPAFYPADETGAVAEDAQPVTPEEDFETYQKGFGHAEKQDSAALYDYADGVYSFTGRDGETRHRVYGRLDGAEPAFYPADETGAIAEGAQPVTPEEDFEAYVKGYDVRQPAEIPEIYQAQENGVYAVEDREGNKLYRTYGVKDGQAPAWYPCDENGAVAEDAQPVTADEDYETFYRGFEPARADNAPTYYFSTKTPSVFMFQDQDGNTQYRVYGSKDRGENAWYPCDETGAVAVDALPVQPASDLSNIAAPQFGAEEPQDVPAFYERGENGVYTVEDRDGEKLYRIYGDYDGYLSHGENVWYPCDENGVVAEDAQPVDPDEDFSAFAAGFTAREPEQVPAYYERGENGVYAVENRQGGKEYRVYGRVNGQPAAWHAADENGNILDAQSAPVDPYDDFVAHVQGFEREEPETTPAHYEKTENGLYAFKNAQGETEYRAYGSKDRGGANWYAVDEEGKLIAEDAQPVNPDEEEAFVTEEPTAEPTEAAVPAMTLTTATAEPTTEAVVTEAPATEVPVTEAPATQEPVTQAPATQDPVTEAPVTQVPATQTPVTQAPATQEPVRKAPATQESVTEAPTTQAVITEAPATSAATEAPTAEPTEAVTEAPATSAVTEAPTAEPTEAVTEVPATSVVTEAPTAEPTEAVTEAPATSVVTEAPTAEPTEAVTEAPATEEPTAEPTPEPKDESKSSSWWIALVAAVLAVAGGGTAIATKKKKK